MPLRSYFRKKDSDIDCNDIAKDLKWDVKTVKGGGCWKFSRKGSCWNI